MPVTSVRLKDDLKESLDELADKLDRSRNWVINEAIEQYIVEDRKLEERRWQETLEAFESIEKHGTVPWEEVKAWMRSWGTDSELPKPTPRK